MGWFKACFAGLAAPRTGNAVRRNLLEVLTIAATTTIRSAASRVDFADVAADREALFREFLKVENGLPSQDAFSRLLRLLDPAIVAACFGRFVERFGAAGQGVLASGGDGDRWQDAAPPV